MNDAKVIPILKRLNERGWTSLRSMATLLGYAHAVQIYQRQQTKHKIQVIKVGGTNRVYETEVIRALENTKHRSTDAQMYLSMYNSIKIRNKEKEHE